MIAPLTTPFQEHRQSAAECLNANRSGAARVTADVRSARTPFFNCSIASSWLQRSLGQVHQLGSPRGEAVAHEEEVAASSAHAAARPIRSCFRWDIRANEPVFYSRLGRWDASFRGGARQAPCPPGGRKAPELRRLPLGCPASPADSPAPRSRDNPDGKSPTGTRTRPCPPTASIFAHAPGLHHLLCRVRQRHDQRMIAPHP
jgi:hypothetical protein